MSPQGPSPVLFFDTITAYQKSGVVKAALELEVFTAIGEGASTVDEVAARIGASGRGTRIICDYLVVLGMLTKEDNRYALTEDSAVFLDKRSPAYAGGIAGFLMHPQLIGLYDDIASVVRTGTTGSGDEGTMEPDHPIWIDFARGMMAMMQPAALAIADLAELDPEKPARILDIAAGHGLFGLTLLQRYTKATVTALDWPRVLDVARGNAEAFGVLDRWSAQPGSAFEEDFGEGYDIVLLTNFLHHFDRETNVSLMKKSRAALGDGGKVITLEFVPYADRVTPPMQAAFSMVMLASTRAGDAYTFEELDSMFKEAGLSHNEARVLPGEAQTLIVSQV